VDREFIEDNFNLYGLRAMVPHYNEALDMILDIERMDEAISDDRQVCSLLLFTHNKSGGKETCPKTAQNARENNKLFDYCEDAHRRKHADHRLVSYRLCTLCTQAKIESSAEYLYGLIHARYVLTSAGLNAVLEKYYNAEYGRSVHPFLGREKTAHVRHFARKEFHGC
jgi:casein kinase II subunit beta